MLVQIYRAPLVIKQDSEEGRKCNLRLVGQKAPGTSRKIHSAIFFSSASLILFVCPHTLGFNIHLHWRYLRGTGEHQLCPPICCGDRPEHLDPPKKLWEKQQQAKRQLVRVWLSVWRLCAGLWYVYVCVCVYLSLALLWVWTQLPGASYSPRFTLHLQPSVVRSFNTLWSQTLKWRTYNKQASGWHCVHSASHNSGFDITFARNQPKIHKVITHGTRRVQTIITSDQW